MSRDRSLRALLVSATCLVALRPAGASAQQFRADSASEALNQRTNPDMPPRAVEIPRGGATASLVGAASRPIVEVTVNGQGPWRFIVETGAPFSSITPEMATALGLAARDTVNPVVRVASMRIGGAELREFDVSVFPAPSPVAQGILGLNAYRDLLLTVDYAGGMIRLERGTLPPANGRELVELVPVDDLWGIHIVANGDTGVAVIDTQGSGAFNITPQQARALRFEHPPVVTGMAQGPGIGRQELRSARLDGEIRVGGFTFQRPIVGLVPMPPGYPEMWNMGGPSLSQFIVTLDQRTRVLRLARASRVVEPPPAARAAGLRTAMRDGGRVVLAVEAGGAADAAGVRAGDLLVQVNGRSAGDVGDQEWSLLSRGAAPLFLRLSRGGATRELSLTPAVLVP